MLEIEEELHATFRDLRFLAAVETIFHFNGALGHGIVFVDVGRLDPLPLLAGAALTETDGTVVPVVWRPFDDEHEPLPLYPGAAATWVRQVADDSSPLTRRVLVAPTGWGRGPGWSGSSALAWDDELGQPGVAVGRSPWPWAAGRRVGVVLVPGGLVQA